MFSETSDKNGLPGPKLGLVILIVENCRDHSKSSGPMTFNAQAPFKLIIIIGLRAFIASRYCLGEFQKRSSSPNVSIQLSAKYKFHKFLRHLGNITYRLPLALYKGTAAGESGNLETTSYNAAFYAGFTTLQKGLRLPSYRRATLRFWHTVSHDHTVLWGGEYRRKGEKERVPRSFIHGSRKRPDHFEVERISRLWHIAPATRIN